MRMMAPKMMKVKRIFTYNSNEDEDQQDEGSDEDLYL
jgi:hypothetical protein